MPATLVSRVLTLVLLTATVARAHEPKLLDALSAIDIVPTAEQLARVTKSPEAALDAVARDGALSAYVRERAISLLSAFPTPDVAVRLEALAASNALSPRLRAMAVYTRVRGFGTVAPEGALAFATTQARSADPVIRESALRGLRWVALPAADAVLEKALAAETQPALQAAIRHVLRARAEIRRAAETR